MAHWLRCRALVAWWAVSTQCVSRPAKSFTCAERFGNLDNYGGFPAIPSKNPFSTGVF